MEKTIWQRDRILGAGSYGTVFKGFTNNPNFPIIAVKSATLSTSSSLIREEIILRDLEGCDNVVRCVGNDLTHVEYNGGIEVICDLFLEFAPGGTLEDLIKTSNGLKMAEDDVSRYTRMILHGIRHVHGRGYVHCDLKPSNILVFGGNQLKIADFGLSKKAGQIDYNAQPSVFRGTPLYMSPESLAPIGQHEPPMDIWSLGCIILEMVTGKPAWPFSDTKSLYARLAYSEELPELPEDMSETGKDFLKMCFDRNYCRRWTADMLLKHPFVAEKPQPPLLPHVLYKSVPMVTLRMIRELGIEC